MRQHRNRKREEESNDSDPGPPGQQRRPQQHGTPNIQTTAPGRLQDLLGLPSRPHVDPFTPTRTTANQTEPTGANSARNRPAGEGAQPAGGGSQMGRRARPRLAWNYTAELIGNQSLHPNRPMIERPSEADRRRNEASHCAQLRTEFMIAPKGLGQLRPTMRAFLRTLVENYNTEQSGRGMTVYGEDSGDLTLWAVDGDSSAPFPCRSSYQKISLISPLFNVCTKNDWRDQVRRTWAYLHRYYEIQRTPHRHTYILVEGCYDLEKWKRIAQAIIHFEPALRYWQQGESENPDPDDLLKANWRDNPCLKGAGINQPQSIALIGALLDEPCASQWREDALSALMGSRKAELGDVYPHGYYWEFGALTEDFNDMFFYNPPPLISATDAIWWLDFVSDFLAAAESCESAARLQRYNTDVLGLDDFLFGNRRATVPNMARLHSNRQTGGAFGTSRIKNSTPGLPR